MKFDKYKILGFSIWLITGVSFWYFIFKIVF